MPSKVEVIGLEEIKKVLTKIAPKEAANLARATIHGLASTVTKEAKKRVPTDKGTLKKAIKAKRKKSTPDKPISDVIVTQGNSAKADGFYWHFVEYGTGGPSPQAERPFLRPARDFVQANMPKILDEQFKKKLVSAVNRAKKKAAKK